MRRRCSCGSPENTLTVPREGDITTAPIDPAQRTRWTFRGFIDASYTNTTLDLRARTERYRAAAAAGLCTWPDGDRPDVVVEDFDLAENLMIEMAVVESGYAVVRRTVAAGHEMTDLAGFAACLALLGPPAAPV